MKLAIFDLGTNVFSLLLAVATKNGCARVETTTVGSHIGKGGFQNSSLSNSSIISALDAIEQLKERADNFGVDEYKLFATSAIRDSCNGEQFVSSVKEKFGFDVDVISGDREAELIYRGVTESLLLYDQTVVIMDVGGGSNELIIGNSSQIFYKESFPIGVIRIKEQIASSDPITREEQERYLAHLDEVLLPFYEALELYKPELIIGTSGSFDTLRELIFPDDDFEIPSKELPIELFRELHEKLLLSNREERLKMKGISPLRADYMVLGSIFVSHIIDKTGIELLYHSSFSLKEGYMVESVERLIKEG